jgi:signal transduction histidine kinase
MILIFCVLGAILIISLSQITKISIFNEIPIIEATPTKFINPNVEGITIDPNPTVVVDVESVQSEALYKLSSKLQKAIIITVSSVLLFGIMATVWLSGFITKPVKKLTQDLTLEGRLAKSDPQEAMHTQELTELQSAVQTSLERFENQFQKQNQFILDAAHELGTPVAAIRMNIDVARQKPAVSPDDYLNLFETVDRSTTRLEKLLDQLKTLSRTESQIQASNINVSYLLEESIGLLIPLANSRNIHIENLVQPAIHLYTEPLFVQTIFTNIIENAIKYNLEGGKVVITANENELGCDFVIEDTGIGISEDEIVKVFHRFYRIDKSRSRRSGGTGLGLSIVQSLLTRLGGKVIIQSQIDTGTTVEVYIPNYQPSDETHID